MKKIKLNLDELRVNSFETAKSKSNNGTIQGNADHITEPIHTYDNCSVEGELNIEIASKNTLCGCTEPTWPYICETNIGATCYPVC